MSAVPIVSALSIGGGVAATLAGSPHGEGRVIGVFRHGVHLRFGRSVVIVAGPALPPGPIHLVMAQDSPAPPLGSMARLWADRLEMEAVTIGLSEATPYQPRLPTPAMLCAATSRLAEACLPERVPADLSGVWTDMATAIARLDIAGAGRLLQGLGNGLTPSGDDVLAGLLLFYRWMEPSDRLPARVAEAAETTDLSRSILEWAARGESVEPVHALVRCAAGPGDPFLFQSLLGAVRSMGASSGEALLAGLGLMAQAVSAADGAPADNKTSPLQTESRKGSIDLF